MASFLLLLGLAGAAYAAAPLGWQTGVVKHYFHDTKHGQLHYVIRGEVSKPGTLVYFHSHPRSSTEFKHVLSDLGDVNFLSVDYFGMGMSEDYSSDKQDDFCTFEVFAQYALEILNKHRVGKFTPMGWLKGFNAAVELAALAGKRRVQKLVVGGPLILSPANMDFIEHMLIPMSKNPKLEDNGSHVLNVWQDPSGTDPQFPADMLDNQDKTNDALRSLFTNWQYQAAWVAYNNRTADRLEYVDSFARSLVIHPTIAMRKWATFNLDVDFSLAAMDRALTHGHNTTHFFEATEGMMGQNASEVAKLLKEFLQEPQAEIAV
eukprot:TRINITY_DN65500_c0_g1_i1.p1 TRINITY_DN65500_c0_g1~~TRINITY_DN65500_c0_g1_i1.p1  ORF type:complete len:319 (+),score=69.35 TRINITY_DN65500_c0_g1_i1:64-1020(+)